MTRAVVLYISDILQQMEVITLKGSTFSTGRIWGYNVQAGCDALGFVRGMTYEQFAQDKKTINAVLRSIEVIGEAAKKCARERPGPVSGYTMERDGGYER